MYVLTSRPGRLKMVVVLPRPRTYEAITQELFTDLKADLLAALREETTPAKPQVEA